MNKKPLGRKCYGSIAHLPGSRTGTADHHCPEGQARIATQKRRDKHTVVIVQEKLDGSNVGVCKVNGRIIPLGRAGYLADSSPYKQHKLFAKWVLSPENYSRFDECLEEGERLCGEWMLQAVGTKYDLPHEPFVVFDLMKGDDRLNYEELLLRVKPYGFITPNTIYIGDPLSVEDAMKMLKASGHGALEEVEGAVWRVESKGKVEFLVKYVKQNKVDGKYFPENNNGEFVYNKMHGEPILVGGEKNEG